MHSIEFPDEPAARVSNATADGESLAISVPRGETAVLKHLQARMPYEARRA